MSDIALAKQTLGTALKTRTDEIAALQVASDLLNDTFAAEFTNLELAQREATDFAAKLNEEKTAHEATKTDLEAKKATIVEQDATIVTLQAAANVPLKPDA